jgi:hypothetical protein
VEGRRLEFDTCMLLNFSLDESFGQVPQKVESKATRRGSAFLRFAPNVGITDRIQEIMTLPTKARKRDAAGQGRRFLRAHHVL